ncbi:hypothetical protein [Herbaspirillum autotrophicum]|uniref:hypothetical protein n=1 Tax=Herbaspirillum autotrophicum TaxID=180195 RepID=UPI0018DBC448|nr:hypothetical protein [Herbaspirillum autotrophicum]
MEPGTDFFPEYFLAASCTASFALLFYGSHYRGHCHPLAMPVNTFPGQTDRADRKLRARLRIYLSFTSQIISKYGTTFFFFEHLFTYWQGLKYVHRQAATNSPADRWFEVCSCASDHRSFLSITERKKWLSINWRPLLC